MPESIALQLDLYPKLDLGTDLPEPKSLDDVLRYDRVVVAFSGGKDSVAMVLYLLDLGVPKSMIELWHHDVDGREGSTLMDWPSTPDYCRKFAEAFGLKMYFSWRVGGIEGEMYRDNQPTGAVSFETPDRGLVTVGGDSKSLGTRFKWPAKSANLSVRWCSSVAKIDVMARAITNQERFLDSRTLVLTGERAEESSARAKYKTFEPHRADNRRGKRVVRYVDQWRPVHAWPEWKIWELFERHRVRPAAPYRLGFSRLSCMTCVFLHPDQWATIRAIDPERFKRIRAIEVEFEHTIDNKKTVEEMADKGAVPTDLDPDIVHLAMEECYEEAILLEPGEEWEIPAGAYGDASCGPS